MTEDARDTQIPQDQPEVPTQTIVVPSEVPMVTLLGPRDELLRIIERAFPQLDIHVRGNEITVTGAAGRASRWSSGWSTSCSSSSRTGQPLTATPSSASIAMLRSADHASARPTC